MNTIEKEIAVEKKDLLVAYHGGGYDGCFWEWNFFSYDKNGKFFNIFSSGREGIKTEEQAIAIIDQVASRERESRQTMYVYDLTKESEINDFQNSHAVPHVLDLVKKLNAGEFGEYSNELFFKCDKCGEKATDGHAQDWHGCGGIEMTADTKLCEDCCSNYTCSECGEYDTSCPAQGGMCDNCMEDEVNAAVEKAKEQNYFYLKYNRLDNTLRAVEIDDCKIVDILKQDNVWCVEIFSKDGYFNYLIDSPSEEAALNDVAAFLDNQYYTASIKIFTMSTFLEEVNA